MKTFAILGAQPSLSREEIRVVLGVDITPDDEVALFETKESLDDLQGKLGGVSKMGSIVASVTAQTLEATLKQELEQVPDQGKLRFGISVYSMGGQVNDIRHAVRKIGISVKKAIKETGRSIRYVESKEPTLSSVVVSKNNLQRHGTEFVLLVRPNEILLGRTQTVQDFENWGHRDYHRPARDAKRGMLPPKLARMMVNLSGTDTSDVTVLDPFCGSGTVLMESAMLGSGQLVGSDILEQAVEDTRENLAWLKADGTTLPNTHLVHSSAAELSKHLDAESIGLLVTEPFLGKPRSGKETKEVIKKQISELETLYSESFGALKSLLKPGARIVIANPVHIIDGERFPVPTKDILEGLGYTSEPFSEPLTYERKGQFVAREILRFSA
ncbi:methyltransferase domain-containing protein [Candidatus Uhrbacteria bacterium]|jgi:tRNA G10  N-methylase Trm11|nr:methyltransferase domain-containing protein [Candidatus Uhrbacteria bacterium]